MVQADAAQLPFSLAAADAAVSGFAVRNFADLKGVINELGRVLRPGGRLALLEVGEPRHRLVRLGHRAWFTQVVPRLGALLSDGAAYRYLPRSVAYLPPLPELRQPSSRRRLHRRQARPVQRRDRPVRDRDPMRRQRRLMNRRATRLFYAARPIDAGTLARLRVLAYETGRVIERDGLTVLGFGVAASLELSGGLANLPGLEGGGCRSRGDLSHRGRAIGQGCQRGR